MMQAKDGEYSQIYNRMEETIFKGIENKLARSFAELHCLPFCMRRPDSYRERNQE